MSFVWPAALWLLLAQDPAPPGGAEKPAAPPTQPQPSPATPGQGTPAQPPPQQQQDPFSGIMSLLIPLGLCFFIIYFMMIRPQKRQMKEREEMLGSVRKGDEVVTSSGLIGTIQKIKDQEIVLVIDPEHNVKVKMLKSAVLKINKASGQDDDEEEEKKPDSTQKEAKS